MRSFTSSLVSMLTMLALGSIWLLPPYLHLGNDSILTTIIIQVLGSLVIMLLCGLFFYKKTSRPQATVSNAQNTPKKNRLKKCWGFFKTQTKKLFIYIKTQLQPNARKKNKLLNRLPWYLVIGSRQSGKSSLLAQSDLSLLPTDYLQNISRELNYPHTWHLTKEAILLELAFENQAIIPESFWNTFIKFSRRYHRKTYFNGVVITLDLPEIIADFINRKESSQQSGLKTVVHQLNHILRTPVPVYIVLTKCDQLAGFQEFFADLTKEDREQIWGIIFSKASGDNQQLLEYFSKEFDCLVARLQERLLRRLDMERDPQKRSLLSYFPQQIKMCKNLLTDFIIQDKRIQLQGIFFTSSLQAGTPLDISMSALANQFHLEAPVYSSLPPQKRAFFAKCLFAEVILPENNWVYQTVDWHKRDLIDHRTTLTATAILVLLGTTGLSISLVQNKRTISQIENSIPLYSQAVHDFSLGNRNLVDLAPVLTNLKRIQNYYSSKNHSWIVDFEIYQPWNIHHQLVDIWQNSLSSVFMPRIAFRLEALLQQDQLDPEILYQALKGYLVFSQNAGADPQWLKNPIRYDLSVNLRNQPNEQLTLNSFLNEAINYPINPISLNNQLIAQTRQRLKTVPPVQFTYYEIKQDAENSNNQFAIEDNIGNDFSAIFTYVDPSIKKLPYFYTYKGYGNLQGKRSKDFIVHTAETYKILGINPDINTEILSEQMTPALWALYSSDYTQHWQNLLSNLRIVNFTSLPQAIQTLNTLSNTNNPLVKLLLLVKANTAPLNTGNLQISQQFSALNAVNPILSLHKDSPSTYDELFKNLQNLRDYLITLNNSPNIDQMEFQDAVTLMDNKVSTNPIMILRHQAEQLPPPLNQWVTQITNNCMTLLFKGAHRTINTAWQNSVLPFYRANIHGRYPFAADKLKVVDIDNFSKFFGGKGIFNQFFQNYLAPFIETDHGIWRQLQIDNVSLQLGEDVLGQIHRAALLSNMYFQNGDNKPAMQFSIQPLFLDAESSSVYVQLSNQTITYRHGPQQLVSWVWPANADSQQVSLSFSDFQGQNFSQSLDGPWAWFEMLNETTLQPGSGNGRYIWTFSQEGHKASFYLIATNSLPLFDFKGLKQFNLPNSI